MAGQQQPDPTSAWKPVDESAPPASPWSDVNETPQKTGILDTMRSNWHSNVDPIASDGTLGTAIHNVAGRTAQNLTAPLRHPWQTLGSIAQQGADAFSHNVNLNDPLVQRGQEFAQEYKQDKPLAFENLAGDVAGTALQGGALKAASAVPRGVMGIAERYGGYNSPVISAPLQSASKVATAIRPVGGVAPQFESDLATQLPRIRAFAQESGNPLHSQWEAAQAARSLGEKGLGHFNEQILAPHEGAKISMSEHPEYQGPVYGEGKMTSLGSINARLGQINDLIRGAERTAKTTGQSMTAHERLGLDAEANALRDRLYTELSQRTGLSPEVIKDLRQSYGQQFGIADTIDAARRARMGQIGAEGEGTTVPLSKAGLISGAVTKLRGGQEYLANKNFRNAIRDFPPEAQQYPKPRGGGQ